MKIFDGRVMSVTTGNTAVVEVVRRTPHPLYKKLIKRSNKFKIDTLGTELVVGDRIKIVETKPTSKGKYFKLFVKEEKKKGGVKKNGSA